MLLSRQWISEENKMEIRKYPEENENKTNKQKKWQTKNYGTGKAVIRGSLQHYNYVSGNKKNLK